LIDLHCHILPGIDDGAASLEKSLVMARQAVRDGIQTVVATPHHLNGLYQNALSDIVTRVNHLSQILEQEAIALKVVPGSEIHVCEGLSRSILKGEAATINGNNKYALLEFPVQSLPHGWEDELFKISLGNVVPVIAHPERLHAFQRNLELLYDLVAMGCMVQLTAMSITGELGEPAMVCSHALLKRRLAHVIATDAHSPEGRPLILSRGVMAAARVLGSREEAETMVTTHPEAIISGKPVEFPEPVRPTRKKWWPFFRK